MEYGFSVEQSRLLARIVRERIVEKEREIAHTDSHEYKTSLREEVRALEEIAERFGMISGSGLSQSA